MPTTAQSEVKLKELPSFRVLGVRVHALQIPETVAQVEKWISQRRPERFVSFSGMHGVSESIRDASVREVLNSADLVVPDGMSLVWVGRHRGQAGRLRRRVYGPEFMETFIRETGSRYRHFFYGGAPGVAVRLAAKMQRLYGIQVAGTYCPPFRSLTEDEEVDLQARVRESSPHVLWVGLSTPKQERWMHAHRGLLGVPVLLGVGAAFDFHTGGVQQAPAWMQENGLEWFFRLAVDPRRLWRRYLISGPRFAWNASLELLNLRKFT
ncbi:MAG TPA: WecB/TagA/CpsF family glycosyltransferase [Terriglobia bacterium]|nr:WecB/TagA/CpsF family glycosyltransferase [Terriglobia bacterium]